jgi:hypothetical protein
MKLDINGISPFLEPSESTGIVGDADGRVSPFGASSAAA